MKQSADGKFGKDLGPVRKTVQRLDAMLNLWEESMAYEYLMGRLYEYSKKIDGKDDPNSPAPLLEGAVMNYRELRRHLLSLRSYQDYDAARFSQVKRAGPVPRELVSTDALDGIFPTLLAQWRLTSSRIYNPSEDLELILVGTRLNELTWKDVTLPFDSFGIAAPVPVRVAHSEVPHDLILVNSVSGDEHADRYLTVSVFPESLANVRKTSQQVVQKTAAEIQAGRVTGGIIRLVQGMADSADRRRFSLVRLNIKDDERVVDTLEAARQEGFEQPIKIVAGLCLYLANLRKSRSGLASPWTPSGIHRAPTMDARAITDEAEICSVATEYVLTPEMKTAIRQKYILRREGVEMPAGFVEAYYRRKKGTGGDPDAPRIEHVHSYSRGFERLAEGALPGGTQGKMRRSGD